MSAHGTKKTVYEIVTEQILKALEQGVVPWRKPWATGFQDPMNISGRRYRGINRVLLGLAPFASPVWLTWKQIQERGGQVKRGEHAQLVVYWMERNRALPGVDAATGGTRDAGGADSRTKPGRPSDEAEQTGRTGGIIPLYYRVFNVEQTDGIDVPDTLQPPRTAFTQSAGEILTLADGIVRTMPNPPSIGMGGPRAYYRPATDHIQMPPHEVFRDSTGYATTLFHEATHATGHPSRLGRLLPETLAPFGSADYSREELIAEIGACFLLRRTGIGTDISNSTAYIRGWLKALNDNPTWVIGAATQAQRASDYILGPEEPRAAEQPSAETTPTTGSTDATTSLPSKPRWAGVSSGLPKVAPAAMPVGRKGSAPEAQRPRGRSTRAGGEAAAAGKASAPVSAESSAERPVAFPQFLTTAEGALDVTMSRGGLADAWTRVRKAVPRQHAAAPLMQVHVQAAEGALVLTGSDGEWVRQERIPADVHRGGVLTVAAAPVQTLLSKLKGSTALRLAQPEGGFVELRAGATRYRIAAGSAGDYPAPARLSDSATTATTSGDAWARALRLVAHAMGDDQTRAHLCGVYLDPGAEGLRIVATDGHRLAVAPVAAESPFEDEGGRILPRAVVPSLAGMLKAEDRVTVRWDTIGVEFVSASGRLATRWVDGTFPNLEHILAAPQPHRMRVQVGELQGALERVRAVASDRTSGVRIEVTDGQLTVGSTDVTVGEASESIPVEYTGPKVEIGFDPRYLLDVLDVARGAREIEVALRDGLSPASFRIAKHPGFVAVVMPMRL